MGTFIERTIASPPLVIAFRGQALTKVMKIHRISTTDLNSALRKENIWHIKEIECVIIGTCISIARSLKQGLSCCSASRVDGIVLGLQEVQLSSRLRKLSRTLVSCNTNCNRVLPFRLAFLTHLSTMRSYQPPEVLLDIKGYKALHEKHEKSGKGVHDSSRDHHDDDIANECA